MLMATHTRPPSMLNCIAGAATRPTMLAMTTPGDIAETEVLYHRPYLPVSNASRAMSTRVSWWEKRCDLGRDGQAHPCFGKGAAKSHADDTRCTAGRPIANGGALKNAQLLCIPHHISTTRWRVFRARNPLRASELRRTCSQLEPPILRAMLAYACRVPGGGGVDGRPPWHQAAKPVPRRLRDKRSQVVGHSVQIPSARAPLIGKGAQRCGETRGQSRNIRISHRQHVSCSLS